MASLSSGFGREEPRQVLVRMPWGSGPCAFVLVHPYQGSITLRGNDEISELARAFDEAGHEVRSQMELEEKREQTLRSFLENTTHDVMCWSA